MLSPVTPVIARPRRGRGDLALKVIAFWLALALLAPPRGLSPSAHRRIPEAMVPQLLRPTTEQRVEAGLEEALRPAPSPERVPSAVEGRPEGVERAGVEELLPDTLWRTLTGHTDLIRALALSPDGRTLISGGDDRTIRLWDLATGQPRTILTGHTGSVYALALSPDGRTLASAGNDRTIRLWGPRLEDLVTQLAQAAPDEQQTLIRHLGLHGGPEALAALIEQFPVATLAHQPPELLQALGTAALTAATHPERPVTWTEAHSTWLLTLLRQLRATDLNVFTGPWRDTLRALWAAAPPAARRPVRVNPQQLAPSERTVAAEQLATLYADFISTRSQPRANDVVVLNGELMPWRAAAALPILPGDELRAPTDEERLAILPAPAPEGTEDEVTPAARPEPRQGAGLEELERAVGSVPSDVAAAIASVRGGHPWERLSALRTLEAAARAPEPPATILAGTVDRIAELLPTGGLTWFHRVTTHLLGGDMLLRRLRRQTRHAAAETLTAYLEAGIASPRVPLVRRLAAAALHPEVRREDPKLADALIAEVARRGQLPAAQLEQIQHLAAIPPTLTVPTVRVERTTWRVENPSSIGQPIRSFLNWVEDQTGSDFGAGTPSDESGPIVLHGQRVPDTWPLLPGDDIEPLPAADHLVVPAPAPDARAASASLVVPATAGLEEEALRVPSIDFGVVIDLLAEHLTALLYPGRRDIGELPVQITRWLIQQPTLDLGADGIARIPAWLRAHGNAQAYGLGLGLSHGVVGQHPDWLFPQRFQEPWPPHIPDRSLRVVVSFHSLNWEVTQGIYPGAWSQDVEGDYRAIFGELNRTLADDGVAVIYGDSHVNAFLADRLPQWYGFHTILQGPWPNDDILYITRQPFDEVLRQIARELPPAVGLEEPVVTPHADGLITRGLQTFDDSPELKRALDRLVTALTETNPEAVAFWRAMALYYHQFDHTAEVAALTAQVAQRAGVPDALRALLVAAAWMHDWQRTPGLPRTERTIEDIWGPSGVRNDLLAVARAGGVSDEAAERLITHWIRLLEFQLGQDRPQPQQATREAFPHRHPGWPPEWTLRDVVRAGHILWVADVAAPYVMPPTPEQTVEARVDDWLAALQRELEAFPDPGSPAPRIVEGTPAFLERYVASVLEVPMVRGRSWLALAAAGDPAIWDTWVATAQRFGIATFDDVVYRNRLTTVNLQIEMVQGIRQRLINVLGVLQGVRDAIQRDPLAGEVARPFTVVDRALAALAGALADPLPALDLQLPWPGVDQLPRLEADVRQAARRLDARVHAVEAAYGALLDAGREPPPAVAPHAETIRQILTAGRREFDEGLTAVHVPRQPIARPVGLEEAAGKALPQFGRRLIADELAEAAAVAAETPTAALMVLGPHAIAASSEFLGVLADPLVSDEVVHRIGVWMDPTSPLASRIPALAGRGVPVATSASELIQLVEAAQTRVVVLATPQEREVLARYPRPSGMEILDAESPMLSALVQTIYQNLLGTDTLTAEQQTVVAWLASAIEQYYQ